MSNEFATNPESGRRDCDEQSAVAYFLEHPDLLKRHPEVLAALEIGHGVDGTVSLVEQQLAAMRKKSSDVEEERATLIETARTNANLSVCLHKTAVELLCHTAVGCMRFAREDKVGRVLQICRTVFKTYIPGVHLFIHWCGEFLPEDDSSNTVALNGASRGADDQRLVDLVDSLFLSGEPSCGPFSAPERIVLFGRLSPSLRSAVAVSLSEPTSQQRMGILVLASEDPTCFCPGKGTMFLMQLVQLMEAVFAPADETEAAG